MNKASRLFSPYTILAMSVISSSSLSLWGCRAETSTSINRLCKLTQSHICMCFNAVEQIAPKHWLKHGALTLESFPKNHPNHVEYLSYCCLRGVEKRLLLSCFAVTRWTSHGGTVYGHLTSVHRILVISIASSKGSVCAVIHYSNWIAMSASYIPVYMSIGEQTGEIVM